MLTLLLLLLVWLADIGDKWAKNYNAKNAGKTEFFEKSAKTELSEAIRDGIMKARIDLGEDTGHWGNSDWEL